MGFSNLLKAMAYRLVKGWMAWLYLAVLVIFIIVGIVSLKVIGADASMAADVSETSSDVELGLSVLLSGSGGVDLIGACGALFVRGSFISMVVAMCCGLFFAKDLGSGGVKNVIQGSAARWNYALAAVVLTLGIAAVMLLAGLLVSVVSLVALGFSLSAPEPGELLLWLMQVWASVSAYSLIAVAVALLTGSGTVSVLAGMLLGGAAVENLLYAAIGLISGHPDEVRAVFDGYLAMMLSQLGNGMVLSWQALLPAFATILISGVAAAVIMRRRKLA